MLEFLSKKISGLMFHPRVYDSESPNHMFIVCYFNTSF